MTLRHDNPSQMAEVVQFNPLLQNENPYYKNLNRASKNAYDYADNINKIIGYGGCVSRVLPLGSSFFNLYDIVALLDGEIIDNAATTTHTTMRYAIVVTEADDENRYIVCTFCPNFIYPSEVVNNITNFGIVHLNSALYLDTSLNSASHFWLTVGTPSSSPTSSLALGVVTGSNTMFFCGTARVPFTVTTSE